MTSIPGPGRIVWLASYPKSGNTWMRAIVTALATHEQLFAVNQLGSGAQPHHVASALTVFGLDARWLDRAEIDSLRTTLVTRSGTTVGEDHVNDEITPLLRKTHEIYRGGASDSEPFPLAATRAAILVVRDPRDVACSYAPFFGVDIDTAIDAMATEHAAAPVASPARTQTSQPWGTWSNHTASWLHPDVPFPVHLVRYEDLQHDAVGTLLPIFTAIGLECTRERLATAVERTKFERLAKSEAERGFRETSSKTRTFFRRGATGSWREELSAAQVSVIEADHGDAMTNLGYELTTTAAQREAGREERESRRRQRGTDWLHLPSAMGITTRLGPTPTDLPNATKPRPWLQVASGQALVQFGGGARLHVKDGREVTVSWEVDPDNADEDPSWLVQGWGVTLAMLQRGNLSLHAATVRIGDEIVAIAGHRGAGKSTTSMGLRSRGHSLLVDDVTLIEFRDSQAWTTPYARNVHLLEDATHALGMNFDSLPLLAGGRAKVAFRPEAPPETPHRIDRIVVLTQRRDIDEVTLTEARGITRVTALAGHTRRDGLAPLILGQQRYFDLLTALADAAPIQILRRPVDSWSLEKVLDLIESTPSPRLATSGGSRGAGGGVRDSEA